MLLCSCENWSPHTCECFQKLPIWLFQKWLIYIVVCSVCPVPSASDLPPPTHMHSLWNFPHLSTSCPQRVSLANHVTFPTCTPVTHPLIATPAPHQASVNTHQPLFTMPACITCLLTTISIKVLFFNLFCLIFCIWIPFSVATWTVKRMLRCNSQCLKSLLKHSQWTVLINSSFSL